MRTFWASLVIVVGLVGLALAQVPNSLYSVIVNSLPASVPLSGSGEYLAITQGGLVRRISPGQLVSGGSLRPTAATCDATTDITTVMQADIDQFSGDGGGQYLIPAGKGCVISSADLSIPFNIQIVCTQNGGGTWPAADYAAYADFLINSARTIKTVNIANGGRSGVFGCNIVRQGYTAITTLRDSIVASAAFAGTALTCIGQSDVTFQDNLIIGFNTAISAACSRFNARRNRMDSINGIIGVLCFDTCYIDENEVWPFSVEIVLAGAEYQDSNISGVTNSGGKFEITLGTAPATPLVTGDRIVIHDAAGSLTVNGRWTITVIDPTHFTLDGSTFVGGYTTGGAAFLSAFSRAGAGITFGQGQFFGHQNLVLGWDYGIKYTAGNDGSYCSNCWIDGFQISKDPTPVGIASLLTSNNAEFSGYLGQPVRQILLDGASAGESVRVATPYAIGSGAPSGNSSAAVTVNHGSLQIVGGAIVGTPVGSNFIYIADAATDVTLTSVAVGSGNIGFQTSSTGCPKLTIDGVVGPCSFTPVLVGSTTPGTFTYTRQNGTYTVGRDGVTAGIDVVWSAIPGAPTGTDTRIHGLPVVSGTSNTGVCGLGFIAGLSGPLGYRLALNVIVSSSDTSFSLMDPTGVTTGYNPNQLASSGSIQAQCHYLQ